MSPFEARKTEFERNARRLAGLRSERVRYFEVPGLDRPEWNWEPLIGKPIRDVLVHWSWVEEGIEYRRDESGKLVPTGPPSTAKIWYPQDMELVFESEERVYLSAAQYFPDRDELFGMADSVAIVFAEEVARQYRIGPFAPTASDGAP